MCQKRPPVFVRDGQATEGECPMKNKFISILCAAMLVLTMPVLAFGAQFSSPGGTSAENRGTILYMEGEVVSSGGYIVVEGSEEHASHAVIPEGDYAASFRAYSVGEIEFEDFTLTFQVPERYYGAEGVIYIAYGSGNQLSIPIVVDNQGIATCVVEEISDIPSYFTIVLDVETADLPGTGGEDKSPESPQTGVDFTGIAAAAGVMLVAAAGVACVLRKKASVE